MYVYRNTAQKSMTKYKFLIGNVFKNLKGITFFFMFFKNIVPILTAKSVQTIIRQQVRQVKAFAILSKPGM